MQRLLAPGGCPWDREQTLESLIPYLVEETYEVVDAVADGSSADHCEELGDLLLQIVFQSELRFNEGAFGIDDVAKGIVDKLVHRHPHVFGDVKADDAEAVVANWAKLKAEEKAAKGKKGALDGVPRSAPGLLRAGRIQDKAAGVGFDWPDTQGPRDKVTEELAELDEAVAQGDKQAMTHELGDLLFAVVNLGRKLGLDPETALRETTDRFSRRFGWMEARLEEAGKAMSDCALPELDGLWDDAKKDIG